MRRSFKLLSFMGIDIELHITFIVFMLLFLLLEPTFLVMLLVLFTSITLHELSHSLVGRSNNIMVKKIVLLPIGGMAVMEEKQLKPFSEFKMAIAGPLFNYLLCTLIALATALFGLPMLGWSDWNALLSGAVSVPIATTIVSSAFWLNWLLGTFNLFVPAIPLDGGRVFRSALALSTDYVHATRIATTVSTVITLLLFIYALLTFNILLLIIAVFVYFGAASELNYALSNRLLGRFPISKIVRDSYLLLPPETKLDKAVESMISSRTLVAFAQSGKSLKMASIYDIHKVPKSKWKTRSLNKVSVKVSPVRIDAPLTAVLNTMRKHEIDAVPISKNGQIVGVVFRDDIDHVFEILKLKSS